MAGSGYQSQRTGEATKALLDKMESQAVVTRLVNGKFSGPTSDADTSHTEPIIYAPNTGDRTVQASNRLTNTNVVVASPTFSTTAEYVLVSAGTSEDPNQIKQSTKTIAELQFSIEVVDLRSSN